MKFCKEALDELADSIEQSGLVEPIVVRGSSGTALLEGVETSRDSLDRLPRSV